MTTMREDVGTASKVGRGCTGVPGLHGLTAGRLAAAFVVLAVFSPWYGLPHLDTGLGTVICIYGVAASSLILMFGYGGMLSLGNALFLGFGAYTVGLLSQRWHVPVPVAVVAAVVVTAVVATALGLLLVRLSGHYFAVATLGLATAFEGVLIAFPEVTGGASGLTSERSLDLGFVKVADDDQWYVFVIVVTAAMLFVLSRIVAGKRGRLLRLVRNDELAASVLGAPVYFLKVITFVQGALFAAIAGALLFMSQGLVVPDQVGVVPSVQLVSLAVIGGAGSLLGGVVGAACILWVQALLSGVGHYELVVYGILFLFVVFFLPPGLVGGAVAAGQRGREWLAARRAGGNAELVEPAPAGELPEAGSVRAAPVSEGRPGEIVLEVREAGKQFGGVHAVDAVSLQVRSGSVTALIGGNGAGKSTLLNLISGIEGLDRGTVTLFGRDVGSLTPSDRARLGLVRTFQVPRLVEELSVVQNVMLGREAIERPVLRRSARREAAELAEAGSLLADASLDQLMHRPARSLGTGERKYVELVRAMFSSASVLLLDEPAVGLSLEEVEQLLVRLSQLRDRGAAILVIDHNMHFIEGLANYVYVMEEGKVVREGLPGRLEEAKQRVLAQPETSAT